MRYNLTLQQPTRQAAHPYWLRARSCEAPQRSPVPPWLSFERRAGAQRLRGRYRKVSHRRKVTASRYLTARPLRPSGTSPDPGEASIRRAAPSLFVMFPICNNKPHTPICHNLTLQQPTRQAAPSLLVTVPLMRGIPNDPPFPLGSPSKGELARSA